MTIPKIRECSIAGCDRHACAKGLCQKHYQAAKKAEKKAIAVPSTPASHV